MRGQRIFWGLGLNTLERAAITVFQILTVPILAASWGLHTYGTWALITTVPSILILFDLGFMSAATFRMTAELAREEIDKARTTFHSAIQINSIAVAATLLLPICIASLGSKDLQEYFLFSDSRDLYAAIALVSLYSAMVLLCSVCQAKFRASGDYPLGVVFSMVTFCLENGLMLGTVLAGGGLLSALLAWTVGRATGLAVQFIVAWHRNQFLRPGYRAGSADVRRSLVRPSLAAMAIPVGTAITLQGTVIVLGTVAQAAVVPMFVAARTLSRLSLQVSQLITTALMPEFAAASATGERKDVAAMLAAVLTSSMLISIPFAVVLAIFGPDIVRLWSGGHIFVSHALMAFLGASAAFGGVWSPLSNLLLSVNKQSKFSVSYIVVATASVGALGLFADVWEATAAAATLAIIDLAMLVIVGRLVWHEWLQCPENQRTIREFPSRIRDVARRILMEKT